MRCVETSSKLGGLAYLSTIAETIENNGTVARAVTTIDQTKLKERLVTREAHAHVQERQANTPRRRTAGRRNFRQSGFGIPSPKLAPQSRLPAHLQIVNSGFGGGGKAEHRGARNGTYIRGRGRVRHLRKLNICRRVVESSYCS